MKFLKVTLAASLQSWGEDSPWDERMTAYMPTKSGIVGLISGCFGYKHGDPRILELNNNIKIAIRADKPGSLMKDYGTVTSNCDYLVEASGKYRTPRKNTTIVQNKYYLQDARFQVFIQADKDLLNDIHYAMNHPKYLTCLGRKSCVPSLPVIPVWVEADSLYDAVHTFTPEDKKYSEKRVVVEMDYTGTEKGSLLRKIYFRKDSLKDLAPKSERACRKVCSFYI